MPSPVPSAVPSDAFSRYQRLQEYVGWTDEDSVRVAQVARIVEPEIRAWVDDFYAAIERVPSASRVITGGHEQIERLQGMLCRWLLELFGGRYDEEYVARPWVVGWRHVEIGLDQVYTNVALSRLRKGLMQTIEEGWSGNEQDLRKTIHSLNQLLDLDLTIIEDAYQTEHVLRRQRTERLAAIGQVAGGIAHELRNPLNVINTSVYYLLHGKNLAPEKIAEHMHRIAKQVEVSDGVITALSDYAKLPIPELKEVRLEMCLREALGELSLPVNIRVTWSLPIEVPRVLGDHRQLGIVFGNLFRNARDAMLGGGEFVITVKRDREHTEVQVADTGVGIAPVNLSRVLEPLFSTKARGIGLGLAVSRAIVDKHSGTLSVTSELGKGTTFTVRLPAAAPEEASYDC